MKKMQCEVCGSTEIKKVSEDVFECQSCGIQYSKGEIQKLLVEITGTVKVDSSDTITNLYKNARNERKKNNFESCAKYYEQILLYEPNSWEALFYRDLYTMVNCRRIEFDSLFNTFIKGIRIVIEAIENQIESKDEKEKAILEIIESSQKIINAYNDTYMQRYNETVNQPIDMKYVNSLENMFDAKMEKKREVSEALFEMIRKRLKVVLIMTNIAENIEIVFSDDNVFDKFALQAWKFSYDCYWNLREYTSIEIAGKEASDSCRKLLVECVNRIRKYEPDFKEAIDTHGLTEEQFDLIETELKNNNIHFVLNKYCELTGKNYIQAKQEIEKIAIERSIDIDIRKIRKASSPEYSIVTLGIFGLIPVLFFAGVLVLLHIKNAKKENGGELSKKAKIFTILGLVGFSVYSLMFCLLVSGVVG